MNITLVTSWMERNDSLQTSLRSLSRDDLYPQAIRLGGDWQVRPMLDGKVEAGDLDPGWRTVVDSTHLQLALYPDNPYWGDHLRAINTQPWLYRRMFAAPPDVDYTRARLRFGGVDYFADVRLNEQPVGQHEGHFAPFALDVTDLLRRGEKNLLEVEVSAPWDALNPGGMYPADHVTRRLVKGLYEHGEGVIPPNVNPLGIWRPVWLVLDGGVSIDHIQIRTGLDGTISLRLRVDNATQQTWHGRLDLAVEVENHEGPGVEKTAQLQLPPGVSEVVEQLHVPESRLWWPWDHGDPNLYRLNLTLRDEHGQVFDRKSETFGVRTIELERSPDRFTYRINGRPVFARGTSYMPALYLSQCNNEQLAGDIALAKAANLNLLRVHVHVSPPEVYDLCDRQGLLIWQDFELNWIQDSSPAFAERARRLQRDMIDLLGNHPSIITWSCHNEPSLVFAKRRNYEVSPDPMLYEDACRQDPTRPVFICSGQMEEDWTRSGDAHVYFGGLWTPRYTDVYRRHYRLCTEFGFEAPASADTLRAQPEAWRRLAHLEGQIDELWAYQAELIQYYVEHLRRQRVAGCGGYVHFWLADLVPQVGCGVLDSNRDAKSGYDALSLASQPLHVSLEHDGRRPLALWVFNDTTQVYAGADVRWSLYDENDQFILFDSMSVDVAANASQRLVSVNWPANCGRIELALHDREGQVLAENSYRQPFQPMPRPRGYPWKFDRYLGFKVFDRPDAPSLADQSDNGLVKWIPLAAREQVAEWVMRQRFPLWLASAIAQVVDFVNPSA